MRTGVWSRGLVAVIVAGLAVDAVVHAQVAQSYSLVRTSLVSQADLFRVEALIALVAAAAVLVRSTRATALLALLVSAGGVAAVLLYTYADPGPLGPLPDMFDPVWYPEKLLSAVAEGVAAVASAGLLIALRRMAPPASVGRRTSTPGRAKAHKAKGT